MASTNFRTTLNEWPANVQISHGDGILCMGSCFAEHIGIKLEDRKFSTLVNPSGIIYNPVSLAQTLKWTATGHRFPDEDVFEGGGQWHSYYHHSRLSALSREALLENINGAMERAGFFFREKTTRLLLTLGTALVYEHVERGEVVANCHKLPAKTFTRRRLTVEEAVDALSAAFQTMFRYRSGMEIILTVSPVRHLREGMVENQRSKATLVLAAARLAELFPNVHYFPAYELLLDDLRDYRFYAEDMVHPSTQALGYIWDFFSQTYFSEETQKVIQEVEAIIRAAAHRPFQPGSEAHRAFQSAQLGRIAELERRYSFLDLGREKAVFGGF
ncbi:MAG: GSCFA domain-containing protein [Lewinellaceae bacterium]|nr:GSCFA domain-containing protein [Lewinellaceae bacterium]